MLRACAAIERAGIPSVAIVSDVFATMAAAIARAMGVDGIPLAVYPGVIPTDSEEEFQTKVAQTVVPQLVAGLARPQHESGSVQESFAPTEVVFSGSYDEVLDLFSERAWTDGLPIVPPTIERVSQFMAYTSREPADVLGVVLPANRAATVWSVAVNGVMAGCRPEHMPVLVAIVEALADPAFRLEDAGSTPGWEPLVTVSGPMVESLGFNSRTAVLRAGHRANTSVGRFTRLYMRNVCGLRQWPDETDQGAIAGNFHVALAENDDAISSLGWQPHRCDRGFDAADSTVTVRGILTVSAPLYSAGTSATDHLRILANGMADAVGPWAYCAYAYGAQYPLLVLGPSIAAAIAADGWGKEQIREYLYQNVLVDGDRAQDYAPRVSGRHFSWRELAAAGRVPAEYGGEGKVGQVRALLRPEWLDIVVAGNPGRNQSKAYIGNHGQGVPVTRRIELFRPEQGSGS